MASNMKNLSGIKGMMLLHGEKVAIAIVAFIAVWLIYKTTSLPRLKAEFQADKLKTKITEATAEVQNFDWEKAVTDHPDKIKLSHEIAKNAALTVKPDAYATNPDGLDHVVVAPTILRPDPEMLNVVDVYAWGGSGLFAFIDEKIRDARRLARAAEEAEKAKKDIEKQQKEQKAAEQGGPAATRGKRGQGELGGELIDPQHPHRKLVQGRTRPAGVPVQGDERIERASWAVVVAKVPIREQLKRYQDAFTTARGGYVSTRDFPQYKGFMVQRAEIVRGKDLEWKAVPLYDAQRQSVTANKPVPFGAVAVSQKTIQALFEAAAKSWAGQTPDVVDQRFTDPILTLPLPPLVGRDWGADATHPDIPLLANTPALEEEVPLEQQKKQETPAGTDEKDTFAAAPEGSQQPAPGGPGFGGPRPFGMQGGFRGGFGEGPGGPGPGPGGFGAGRRTFGEGPEGGGRPGGGGGFTSMPGGTRDHLPKGVDYLLLRFFDFSVEPGKKYKYRVKLVMADPNSNPAIAPESLAPAVRDRMRQESQDAKAQKRQRLDIRILEKWSDPSPTVGIPLSGTVRLAEAKLPPPDKFNDEPAARVSIESIDLDEGNAIQASVEEDLRRGFVANMVKKNVTFLGPDGTWTDVKDSFKFLTGMTLLDVRGGEKLTKDYTAPSRMLLMGPAGDLYIRNELDDRPAVEYNKSIFEQSKKKGNTAPALGPGEGPGLGPMRGRPPRGGGGPPRG
jgi:hypothetical protein